MTKRTLPELLDWLSLHMEEAKMVKALGRRPRRKVPAAKATTEGAEAAAPAAPKARVLTTTEWDQEMLVFRLVEEGFSRDECLAALGDHTRASDELYIELLRRRRQAAGAAPSDVSLSLAMDEEERREAREDELEALAAMYEPHCVERAGEGRVTLHVEASLAPRGGVAAAGTAPTFEGECPAHRGEPVTVRAFFPAGLRYPEGPPLVMVQHRALPPRLLRRATDLLQREVDAQAGQPCLFFVFGWVEQDLVRLVREERDRAEQEARERLLQAQLDAPYAAEVGKGEVGRRANRRLRNTGVIGDVPAGAGSGNGGRGSSGSAQVSVRSNRDKYVARSLQRAEEERRKEEEEERVERERTEQMLRLLEQDRTKEGGAAASATQQAGAGAKAVQEKAQRGAQAREAQDKGKKKKGKEQGKKTQAPAQGQGSVKAGKEAGKAEAPAGRQIGVATGPSGAAAEATASGAPSAGGKGETQARTPEAATPRSDGSGDAAASGVEVEVEPAPLPKPFKPSPFLQDIVQSLNEQETQWPWLFQEEEEEEAYARPLDAVAAPAGEDGYDVGVAASAAASAAASHREAEAAAQRVKEEERQRKEQQRQSAISDRLRQQQQRMGRDPAWKKMKGQRSCLPAYAMQETILSAVNGSQVVVVSGETGVHPARPSPLLGSVG